MFRLQSSLPGLMAKRCGSNCSNASLFKTSSSPKTAAAALSVRNVSSFSSSLRRISAMNQCNGAVKANKITRNIQTANKSPSKVSKQANSKRSSLSSTSTTPIENITAPPPPYSLQEELQIAFITILRLLSAYGLVYVTTEYGFDITMCEGPSMIPTIQPKGEIVLMEKLSPRFLGLEGGCEKRERIARNRTLQREWEQSIQKAAKQQQQEEEEKEAGNKVKTPSAQIPTWHEPKLKSVQHLPPDKRYKRLFQRVTTGISVGDVVVVQHPNRDGTVCKRVLGLPGDVVVEQQPLPQELEEQAGGDYQTSNHSSPWYEEEKEGDDVEENKDGEYSTDNNNYQRRHFRHEYRKLLAQNGYIVPDGHLWIEGDNTPDSMDSRSYGAVPASLVVGKVLMKIWPLRSSSCSSFHEKKVVHFQKHHSNVNSENGAGTVTRYNSSTKSSSSSLWIERGGRPMPPPGEAFTGSTVWPAGYDGEIMLEERTWLKEKKKLSS